MPIIGGNLVVDLNQYTPLAKQEQFHQSQAKFRLYIGAWRSGKTYAGCIEGYKHSILYPKNCGIIFRKDFTNLQDTTMKTFLQVVPQDDILDFNKSEHRIMLKNGSEIYFRHLKDGLKLGSLSLGWFFIDEAEEIDEEIFTALIGRLSLKNSACVGWLVSNPPNTDHWLYRTFNDNPDNSYQVFYASTYENKANLPQDYIASLEKLPESWRKKYLEGHWGFTPDGRPFYQGFIESLHKKKLEPIKDRYIYRSFDYGYNFPFCSFHQLDAKGRWLIISEIMGREITIEKFGEYIKTYCAEHFPGFSFQDFGDPAGLQKSDKSERTSVEILNSLGIYPVSKVSTYRERKEIIERKLSTLVEGIPMLQIDESCKIIIDGFLGGYHYPIRSKAQAYNPVVMEIPFRDGFYEHGLNSVEYFAVNMFSGAETKEDNKVSSYRVVGDLGDIRFDDDEDEGHSAAYQQITDGR
jgi:hypothetical protein